MNTITQQELRTLLDYNQETGIFTWKDWRGRNGVGSKAGWRTEKGYLRIEINGKAYMAHRLAFLYMAGELPQNQIDHVNRVRNDNRWVNLRLATPTQNACNTIARKNSTSKYLGVSWHKQAGKWRAVIKAGPRPEHLGLFDCEHDAATVYNFAAYYRFGQFANYNTPEDYYGTTQ